MPHCMPSARRRAVSAGTDASRQGELARLRLRVSVLLVSPSPGLLVLSHLPKQRRNGAPSGITAVRLRRQPRGELPRTVEEIGPDDVLLIVAGFSHFEFLDGNVAQPGKQPGIRLFEIGSVKGVPRIAEIE